MAGAAVPLHLIPLLRDVLGSGKAAEHLSGGDLLALAFALAGEPALLSTEAAADALLDHGLRTSLSRPALARHLAAGAAVDSLFLQYSTTKFALDRRVSLPRRVQDILLLAPVSGAALPHREVARRPPAPKVPSPAPSRARPPPPRAAPRSPAQAAPARARAPSAAKPGPASPRDPSPPAPAPPALPPPPPVAAAPVTLTCFSERDLVGSLLAPAAARGLDNVRHVLSAHRLAIAEHFEELLSFASLSGVEPHRYQLETVRRVLRVLRGRALLADEVGLGKTIEALIVLREYQLRGMVRRALILVPPALVRQWSGEIAEKVGIAARSTEDADLRDDPEAFWSAPGVAIASIATARLPRHAPLVQASPWDLVIVDEAHHVKNRKTVTFKLVDGIKSRFLLMLTATPIETDLEELYNLVTLLKPGQFATPAAFRARFVDPKDPLSLKNREKLRELLGEVMVRNTRADSGLRLPPRYVTTVAVDPLPEEAALYDRIVKLQRDHAGEPGTRLLANNLLLMAGSSPAAVRGSIDRALTGAARSPALLSDLSAAGALAADVKACRKTAALVDLARAHRERVLVFTRFRDTLDHVFAALTGAGVEALRFHGGQTREERARSLDAFREGARVLVATDVGGEGQNLHHCHTLVNFDLPYNPMLLEQRIGRLHRMGQTSEVRVYNLCARGTAEERVLDLLDRRLSLFELVVGELDMVLGNLADERDLEDRILALYAEARTSQDLDRGFDEIEVDLRRARGRYEQVKALDSALFGKDYEV